MGDQPLIGVDDIDTPAWAKGYESTADAGLRAVAREAPRTVASAVRWAWATSRGLTVASAALQLVTGAVTAFGLLATAGVFTQLLEQGPPRSGWWPRFRRSRPSSGPWPRAGCSTRVSPA